MKTLRQHAAIAFLLISATVAMPTFTNPAITKPKESKQEEVTIEPKKTKPAWYKNPEIREKIREILGTALSASMLISGLALCFYVTLVTGVTGPIKQPCNICKDKKFRDKIAKICTQHGFESKSIIVIS